MSQETNTSRFDVIKEGLKERIEKLQDKIDAARDMGADKENRMSNEVELSKQLSARIDRAISLLERQRMEGLLITNGRIIDTLKGKDITDEDI